MPRRSMPLSPRTLALAIALAGAPGIVMAKSHADVCPLGALTCPVVNGGFALCKKNDLLDFYVPGLPTTGDRDASPAQVSGDSFSSPDSNIFHLTGNTALERLDQLLRANSLTYNRDTTAYVARGNVRYQERDMLLSARSMHGTTNPEHGVADDVKYQLLTSRGNGTATEAIVLDQNRAKLHDVSYSTCDIDNRVWSIQARTMTLDQTTGIGHARDVTMRVKGVPFLWLPWMRFPINDERQSGFLYPSFGKRGRAGSFFGIPYYWNIAPNYDATIAPFVFVSRGPMLDGQFRYLTHTSTGALNLQYMPHDKTTGTHRGYLTFSDHTSLPLGLQWNTSIAHASDKEWFQDFGQNLTTSTVTLLSSSSYVTAAGNWWNAGAGADWYQVVTPGLSDTAAPYRRLPRLFFNAERPIGGISGPEWGVNSEAVRFVQPEKIGGDRFDAFPYLVWPLQGAAWFVRPQFGVRYTAYDLPQPVAAGGPTQPTRTTPILDIDSGLVFERQVNLFGTEYTQTLEPRAYYLYVPYRNQQDIPLFDTQQMTFDFWQLFSTNEYSGADRQMNANNLSLALTTRFLDQNGVEKLSASIGQIRYFTPQKVTLRPGAPITTRSGSDLAANVTLALSDNWRVTSSQLWNPDNGRTDASMIGLQRRLWGDGIVNLSYSYRRGLLEQAGMTAAVPVGAAWKLVGGYTYSLSQKEDIDSFFGIEWDSCCTAIQVLSRHYVYNYQGDATNAIMFTIQFKGLGSYGQKTGQFLQNAILGFQ